IAELPFLTPGQHLGNVERGRRAADAGKSGPKHDLQKAKRGEALPRLLQQTVDDAYAHAPIAPRSCLKENGWKWDLIGGRTAQGKRAAMACVRLLPVIAAERRGEAETDEQRAAQIALELQIAAAALQPGPRRSGGERVGTVGHQADQREGDGEKGNL